ncbi:hypothetical protein J6G99_00455 [bacterium]|nr:hypothetical protein [bacterium]
MDEENNKPLIIAIILNIALYFNVLYWLLLFLVLVIISILANYDIIINFPEAAIVGAGLALIFSIINWILKPIILIQTYRHIIKKYPKHCVSYWLKNDIKNKDTKDFLIPILIVLEIIWFTFAYLFYKTGNNVENPIKYALILYLVFGGGLLWSYVILFIRSIKGSEK